MTSEDQLAHLKFPATKAGAVLRTFIDAHYKIDGTLMEGIFAEDALFDGLMYKVKGGKQLPGAYDEFLRTFVISYRVDSMAQAVTDDQWIIMTFVKLKGNDEEVPVVDLVNFEKNSKICRINNCFDVTKLSKEIHDDAESRK